MLAAVHTITKELPLEDTRGVARAGTGRHGCTSIAGTGHSGRSCRWIGSRLVRTGAARSPIGDEAGSEPKGPGGGGSSVPRRPDIGNED